MSKPSAGISVNTGDPLASGLIACWNMAEGSGTFTADAAGYDQMDFVGSPSWVLDEVEGWTIQCSSASGGSYLSTSLLTGGAALFTGGGDFTIQVRCKISDVTKQNAVFARAVDPGGAPAPFSLIASIVPNLLFSASDGVGGQTGSLASAFNPTEDEFVDLIVVVTAGVSALYVDGSLDPNTPNQTASVGQRSDYGIAFTLGANVINPIMDGAFTYARHWNRALTTDEIARLTADPYCFMNLSAGILTRKTITPKPAVTVAPVVAFEALGGRAPNTKSLPAVLPAYAATLPRVILNTRTSALPTLGATFTRRTATAKTAAHAALQALFTKRSTRLEAAATVAGAAAFTKQDKRATFVSSTVAMSAALVRKYLRAFTSATQAMAATLTRIHPRNIAAILPAFSVAFVRKASVLRTAVTVALGGAFAGSKVAVAVLTAALPTWVAGITRSALREWAAVTTSLQGRIVFRFPVSLTASTVAIAASLTRASTRFMIAASAALTGAVTTIKSLGLALTAATVAWTGSIVRAVSTQFSSATAALSCALKPQALKSLIAASAALTATLFTNLKRSLLLAALTVASAVAFDAQKGAKIFTSTLDAATAAMSAALMKGRLWVATLPAFSVVFTRKRYVTIAAVEEVFTAGVVGIKVAVRLLTANTVALVGNITRTSTRTLTGITAAFSAATLRLPIQTLTANTVAMTVTFTRFASTQFTATRATLSAALTTIKARTLAFTAATVALAGAMVRLVAHGIVASTHTNVAQVIRRSTRYLTASSAPGVASITRKMGAPRPAATAANSASLGAIQVLTRTITAATVAMAARVTHAMTRAFAASTAARTVVFAAQRTAQEFSQTLTAAIASVQASLTRRRTAVVQAQTVAPQAGIVRRMSHGFISTTVALSGTLRRAFSRSFSASLQALSVIFSEYRFSFFVLMDAAMQAFTATAGQVLLKPVALVASFGGFGGEISRVTRKVFRAGLELLRAALRLPGMGRTVDLPFINPVIDLQVISILSREVSGAVVGWREVDEEIIQ